MSKKILVNVEAIEGALRDWLTGFDYDAHKYTECSEEDGRDTYPEEAATFFSYLPQVPAAGDEEVDVLRAEIESLRRANKWLIDRLTTANQRIAELNAERDAQ